MTTQHQQGLLELNSSLAGPSSSSLSTSNTPQVKPRPKIVRVVVFRNPTATARQLQLDAAKVINPAGVEVWRCEECVKNFAEEGAYAQHLASPRHAPGNQAWLCPFCDDQFKSRQSLDQHLVSGIHAAYHHSIGVKEWRQMVFDAGSDDPWTRWEVPWGEGAWSCAACQVSFDKAERLQAHLATAKHQPPAWLEARKPGTLGDLERRQFIAAKLQRETSLANLEREKLQAMREEGEDDEGETRGQWRASREASPEPGERRIMSDRERRDTEDLGGWRRGPRPEFGSPEYYKMLRDNAKERKAQGKLGVKKKKLNEAPELVDDEDMWEEYWCTPCRRQYADAPYCMLHLASPEHEQKTWEDPKWGCRLPECEAIWEDQGEFHAHMLRTDWHARPDEVLVRRRREAEEKRAKEEESELRRRKEEAKIARGEGYEEDEDEIMQPAGEDNPEYESDPPTPNFGSAAFDDAWQEDDGLTREPRERDEW